MIIFDETTKKKMYSNSYCVNCISDFFGYFTLGKN